MKLLLCRLQSAEDTLQQELDDKAESVPESNMDDQTALARKADANGGDSSRQGSPGGAGADEKGGQRSHRGGKGGETGRNGGAGADEKDGSAVSGCDRLRGSVAGSCSVRGTGTTVPRVMGPALRCGKGLPPIAINPDRRLNLQLKSR